MNLRRSRGGGGGCGGGRIFHNNFLVKSLRSDGGDDGDQPSAVIGLLAGRYKLLTEGSSFSSSPMNADEEASSALNLHLPPLQLLKFEATTVADELAEFRLLNHKDRVIIRALEGGGKVLFGSKITEEKEEVVVKHYFSLEHQATLVLRGPVTIHYHPHHHQTTVQKALSSEEEEKDEDDEKKTEEVIEENDEDEDDDKEEQDEEKEADKEEEEVANLEQSGGDAIKASSSSSSPSSSSQTNSLQSTKYSGHVALSLMGAATIVVHPPPKGANSSSSSSCTPTEIFLPAGNKFSLDRAVPLRFQQKSIVQRQREQHQASRGLMALETFDHLIGGLF